MINRLVKYQLIIERYRKPDYINSFGTQHWYNKYGELDSALNGYLPAVIRTDGYKVWYKNGKRLRFLYFSFHAKTDTGFQWFGITN